MVYYRNIKAFLSAKGGGNIGRVAAIDKSGSTDNNSDYTKIAKDLIYELFGNGSDDVLVVLWGDGEFFVTDEEFTAIDCVATKCCGGTSAVSLVNELQNLYNIGSVDLTVLTDGQVFDLEYCKKHDYGNVTVHCVNLSRFSVSTDMSVSHVFANSNHLLVRFTDTRNGSSSTVLDGYDARQKNELIEDANADILGLLALEKPTVKDTKAAVDKHMGKLGMAVFGSATQYERLRSSFKTVIAKLIRLKKNVDSTPIANLSVLRNVSEENRDYDDAIGHLQSCMGLLGQQVTSLALDLKQPSMQERGKEVEDVPVKEETFDAADLGECEITGNMCGVVLPFADRDGEMKLDFSDADVAFPLSDSSVNNIASLLQCPFSNDVYQNWVKDTGRGRGHHPLTRAKVSAAIPVLANPYSNGTQSMDTVKAQLAKALFRGKMVGPWSRWLLAAACAATRLEYVPHDVQRCMFTMAFAAAERDKCPVSGSPLIMHPPYRSTVIQSMMFAMAAPFMGFRGDSSDALLTHCLAPAGTAERTLELVIRYAESLPLSSELDPEFAALDLQAVRSVMVKYRSYVALHRLLTKKSRKALDTLTRTLYQCFMLLPGVERPVFLSGPADAESSLAYLRSCGVTCSIGMAYALVRVLLKQLPGPPSNRVDIFDVRECEADEMPSPVVLPDAIETDIRAKLCPDTCRPEVPIDAETKNAIHFTSDHARKLYGPEFIPADNNYGLCVCKIGGKAFPTTEQLLAFTAHRFCTQRRDDFAVLPSSAPRILEDVVGDMRAMIDECPKLRDNPSEFMRRFEASRDFNTRVTMQQQQRL